jgi:hypothetical protein
MLAEFGGKGELQEKIKYLITDAWQWHHMFKGNFGMKGN